MRLHHVAVALLMLSAPVLAQTVEYTCSFPYEAAAGGGWIPQVVVLRDETAKGKVTVYDPLIREFAGAPIAAQRGEQTTARTTYTWQLRVTPPRQSALTMRYRLTHYRNGRPTTITASPAGYDNTFTGRGSCKLKTLNP